MLDRSIVTLADPDTAKLVLALLLTLTADSQKLNQSLMLDLTRLTVANTASRTPAIDGDFATRLLVDTQPDASLQLDPTFEIKLLSTDSDLENTTVTLTDPVAGPFTVLTLLTLLDAMPKLTARDKLVDTIGLLTTSARLPDAPSPALARTLLTDCHSVAAEPDSPSRTQDVTAAGKTRTVKLCDPVVGPFVMIMLLAESDAPE